MVNGNRDVVSLYGEAREFEEYNNISSCHLLVYVLLQWCYETGSAWKHNIWPFFFLNFQDY